FESEKDEINLRFASFKAALEFENIEFEQPLSLIGTSVKNLSLYKVTFSQKDGIQTKDLDLRGCAVENFIGTNEDNLRFLAAQRPESFSGEPYIQLEKYYQKIGDELTATEVYLARRDATRRYALKENTTVHWSWLHILWDGFLNLLARYGTQPWRILILTLAILLLGLIVFQANPSLISTADPEITIQSGAQKFLYLVDLFIPVDLGFADRWKPSYFGGELYAGFLLLIGWLFVPLLIASWSGYFRRQ
ncbi:MAG TPA: hypothetical protein VN843_25265, partial [Anaerolineales bacterium]|nr:hypothetical protein [Anaerolineales bacterium]